MNRFFLSIIGFLFFLMVGFFGGLKFAPLFHPRITKAIAVIHPTQGNTAHGAIHFSKEQDGVRVTAQIKGLSPGAHGFHIHEFGDCSGDKALAAGAHFNPTKQPHAGPDTHHRHSGDLGNLIADQEGVAQYDFFDNQLALNGPYSIIGRSVIVHEKQDDLHTQPTGDSGARIGCGVIGVSPK